MSGLIEKLNIISQIKDDIKQAIINKGVDITDSTPFEEYSNAIEEISGGGDDENWDYEYSGGTFPGGSGIDKCVMTDLYLFTEENINKDWEFKINSTADSTADGYAGNNVLSLGQASSATTKALANRITIATNGASSPDTSTNDKYIRFGSSSSAVLRNTAYMKDGKDYYICKQGVNLIVKDHNHQTIGVYKNAFDLHLTHDFPVAIGIGFQCGYGNGQRYDYVYKGVIKYVKFRWIDSVAVDFPGFNFTYDQSQTVVTDVVLCDNSVIKKDWGINYRISRTSSSKDKQNVFILNYGIGKLSKNAFSIKQSSTAITPTLSNTNLESYTEASLNTEYIIEKYGTSLLLKIIPGAITFDEWIDGQYIETDGSQRTYAGWHCTDFIEIPNGVEIIHFTNSANKSEKYNCFYDENKTKISSNFDANNNTITVPSNAKYMRLSLESAYTITAEYNSVILKEWENAFDLSYGVPGHLAIGCGWQSADYPERYYRPADMTVDYLQFRWIDR